MADFKTHLVVGTSVCGTIATCLMVVDLLLPQDIGLYVLIGVVGSLLPDIDADNSIPLKTAFTITAIASAFFALAMLGEHFSIAELLLLWVFVYFFVRFGLFFPFTKLTQHRGIIHSIPAGILVAFITVMLVSFNQESTILTAWMMGGFIFIGFLTHLVLDEIYSVDLLGLDLKQSFGSAVKLGSRQNIFGSICLYVVIASIYILIPPPDQFFDTFSNPSIYIKMRDALLPQGNWFLHH